MSGEEYVWRPARTGPPPLPPQTPPRRGYPAVVVLLTLLTVGGWLLAAFLVWRGLWGPGPSPADAQPRTVTPRGDLMEIEKTTEKIYEDVKPSVVYITTLGRRRGWNLNAQEVPKGTGSGFIWTDDGYIVTNFHVVQDVVRDNGDGSFTPTGSVRVTLSDQSSWKGTVVGYYPDKDIAVVSIGAPASKLKKIEVGSSADLKVGQSVFAIGDPFGLDYTLTTGVISATGREIQSVTQTPIKNVIQTDAPINPGNSGGPLLDSDGRLIGMNTAIYSPSGASSGIGFAIPVDEINRVAPQIIARKGRLFHPGLGARYAPDQAARRLHVDGVLVLDVDPDGAAAKAGLQPSTTDENGDINFGDIITAVDGKEVHKISDLDGILDDHKIGDTVTLSIVRGGPNGKKMDVKATLEGQESPPANQP